MKKVATPFCAALESMRHIVRLLLHRALKICKKNVQFGENNLLLFCLDRRVFKKAMFFWKMMLCALFLFQISSTLCQRASSTAFWPGFHEAEAIFSEQIVTPFFPYGLTYPLESAFLQGHITVRKRPIVMFRITDQSILSKKKSLAASVAKTLQAVFIS